MQKHKILITTLGLILNLPSSLAFTLKHATYLGADLIYANTRLERNYGGNVFSKKMAPGVNLFLGHMFNNYFGGEAGFEIINPNKQTILIPGEETVLGVKSNDPDLTTYIYQSKINQYYSYFGLTAKTKLINNCSISLLVGGAMANIRATANNLSNLKFDNAIDETLLIIKNNIISFNKTKLIPTTKINFELEINKNNRVNVLFNWKKTSNIKIKKQYFTNNNNQETIKLKDSTTIGIGFSYLI